MPFKSEKQRKWMWANDPEMARKWEKEEVSNIREKIKNIIREEIKSLNEEKYIVASIYGDLYTPKAVSEKKALKLMMKIADQYAGDKVFMLGVKAWNKPHKYNKKKIKVKEGKLDERMDKRKAAEILKQIGGNKFIAMTGAKGFTFSNKYMSFKIGRNSKGINFVRIGHNAKDLYDMEFGFVSVKGIKVKKKVKDVYADMLGTIFTKYTGMYTSL